MARPPAIRNPGAGHIPSGYYLGRTDANIGDVQLLPIRPPIQPYVISGGVHGHPVGSQVMFDHVATASFLLPGLLTGSFGGVATLGASPAADAVFHLFRNTVAIGTMTIPSGAALGSNTALFVFTDPQSFAPGDHFRLIAPAVADTTLATPFYTFNATRT